MIEENRAGIYIRQPSGYRIFIPKPLPPTPGIEMDWEMWQLLSQADRSLGRLDGSTDALPNPDLFVFMYVRKEAVLSSQIEGTQASLIDVLEFESQTLQPDNPQDVAEVVNYIAAINYGLERLERLPISLRLIKEIHQELMKNVRGAERNPGEFRRTQNWIGSQGCSLKDATFVPPPPPEMQKALNNLEEFLHESIPLPTLIKIGIAHAQFETIHPFLDGNGRTGRLLITFLLCQQNILKYPLLYISYYFKKYRTEYYARLQSVRDRGNWEDWLKFFLQGVYEVAQEASGTARHIVAMKEEHRQLLIDKFDRRAANAITLIENMYSKPIVNLEQVQEIVQISYQNANNLVKDLCDVGLLREITGQKRNRAFAYAPYLDVFDESM